MAEDKRIYLYEDTKLMIKASKGERKAFAEIYVRYFPVVSSFISSLDGQLQASEDIVQDIFVRIWDNRRKYRPTSSLKTFLFSYAKNVFYEYQSKKNKEKALFVADSNAALDVMDAKTDSEDEIKTSAPLSVELISQLPDKQKRVFELVYLYGVSSKEVAKQLECSFHSVYQNLYLARKTLRKLLVTQINTLELGYKNQRNKNFSKV